MLWQARRRKNRLSEQPGPKYREMTPDSTQPIPTRARASKIIHAKTAKNLIAYNIAYTQKTPAESFNDARNPI